MYTVRRILYSFFVNINKLIYVYSNLPYDTDMRWYKEVQDMMGMQRFDIIPATMDHNQTLKST